MLLPPVGAGGQLLLPGCLWLPGGQGDPGKGGVQVGGAQNVTRRHGYHHFAPCPAPAPLTRASLAAFSDTSFRALRPLAALTLGLAWGPSSPDPWPRSLSSLVTCTR